MSDTTWIEPPNYEDKPFIKNVVWSLYYEGLMSGEEIPHRWIADDLERKGCLDKVEGYFMLAKPPAAIFESLNMEEE